MSISMYLSSRAPLIYFLAISILLGGLLSLNFSSKFAAQVPSDANIATQNLDSNEFSWDKARHPIYHQSLYMQPDRWSLAHP